MRGKMREGSAAKAEAPQKIDDDQAEPPSTSSGAPPPRPGACLPITPVQIVIRSECLRSPISMCAGILLIGGRHLRLAGVVTP